MKDITLSQSVRQNLLSLQRTADMMGRTQNRLATGLKVNSALDNPNSFFTSQGLNSRANDLASLLDSMGQGVQTLKAADNGITNIVNLVEAAKAKANQANQTNKIEDRRVFANEFNGLLQQIEDMARDAGYNGKNLLAGTGNDLSVVFNEDSTSKLIIQAIDLTDTSTFLGLNDITVGTSSTGTVTEANLIAGREAGDELTLTIGSDTYTIEYGATTTAADIINALDAIPDVSASSDGTTVTITTAAGNFTLDDTNTTADMTTVTGTGYVAGSFDNEVSVNAVLNDITESLNLLRDQASTFGTNLTVVENRTNFTKQMISTLANGADMLTLADTNEEGANLLALQTRQQLSSTALSMASQADQNVLRLFQ
jgi:flagellin-like hook-associated protein FlgL